MTTLKSDVDRVEHVNLEVARITQEKQDMQRQFEERQAAAIKEQSGRQSNTKQPTSDTRTELTDENGDKTEREADAVAQTAPVRRRGTPIPKHVQMGRYHPSDTASHRQVDERGDQYDDTAIIDTRSEGWRSQEVNFDRISRHYTGRGGPKKHRPKNHA